MKRHHLQAGVGHYGVLSSKCWETEVYPIAQHDPGERVSE
jgi:poly(3-hydroxybutyrate) depolymerase